ncbi:MAG: response regulator transcription factor [Candidatus Wallbacteria bacterium]|nr:response regulator transcription factor [Candidatus Wallbacteria bacterium]
MKKISVLLADDHTVVREGFRALLELETDLEIVGEASNGRQAVELTMSLRPDVVVMDIAMPGLNGLEAAKRISSAAPGTKVIILSMHSDDAYIEYIITLGLAGYLLKQTSSLILCRAIREVAKGNQFYSPAIARRVQQLSEYTGEKKSAFPELSPREMEILQLIAEGRANKQIATDLKISIKTVEKHRQNLMNKLDTHDTARLTRYAISAGIIVTNERITLPYKDQ